MDVTLSPVLVRRDRVEALHGRLTDLLDALDDAELHAPAAYVSMALDTILRDFPELNASR